MPARTRPRRSALYVPGSNARALDKGRQIATDVLILDLEDAVAPDDKETARAAVAAAAGAHAYGRREVVIRVNGLETPWIARDIAAAVGARPDAVLIPKLSRVEDLRRARAALMAAHAPAGLTLWAMIETPLAVLNVSAIAAVAVGPGVPLTCLVIGTNDLARSSGARIKPGRAALMPWLAQCVLAARANDIAVLDGTFNDMTDWKGFQAECEQGRDLGMDGKMLIHPSQIGPVNEIFAPSDAEVAFARKILAIFDAPENADKGVVQIDGQMVERLHLDVARRTLALMEAATE